MKKALFILLLLSGFLNAQNTMFNSLAFSNIGPTVMSGRIVDLAVNPDNPTEFYAAYATGGVWYTNNNGTSFTPIMDSAPTLNCGAIAVDWISKTIWVGTGEVNASRSSYAGVGVLKSVNNGKTWINIGLADSHHISRIWFNPNNTNELVVGSVGHLYTPNSERGVFKTTDGGVTWQKTLFVNDNTGVIDISVSKNNPKTMFAATWQKDRKAWNFNGNGQGSGIYKSIDSGNSWNLISTATSGFPVGENIGRIGLCAVNSETIYAVLDNQNKRPNTKTEISKDSNKAMIETNVIGCEIYKSVNGGLLWTKQNKNFIDDLYYTYGYYFANIAVNPSSESQIYVGGVNLLSSNDNGASFMSISKNNVHSDHHITWINPKNANHIINGNDGGVNISYDKGENWIKCNNQAVGQFYSINVDNQPNYNVYGGL
ncbi:MAG: glycosyl hydrolase, partial [Flavobacterium sp.]|nr:glycosyl hydrolase [Flavobacterium sp.]